MDGLESHAMYSTNNQIVSKSLHGEAVPGNQSHTSGLSTQFSLSKFSSELNDNLKDGVLSEFSDRTPHKTRWEFPF